MAPRATGPRLRPMLRRLVRAGLHAFLGFCALTLVQVVFVRFIDPPLTLSMLEQVWDRWRLEGEVRGFAYAPISMDQMGKDLPVAAVSSEDARFWSHHGFDTAAIAAAWEANQDGGKVRGGSTISQQAARNLFLWQGRSWLRKGLEAWYTLWLEALVPKERILELYLNIAETGPAQFGVEAGARHWYGVAARKLTPNQAGRLIGILPSPRKWTPSGKTASKRAAWIANNPAPGPEPAPR
jgi:monofunctional glycosyltransferase